MSTFTRTAKKFVRYLRTNRAVSAMEYAILVGAIAIAMVAGLATFSNSLKTGLSKIGNTVAATNMTNLNIQNN